MQIKLRTLVLAAVVAAAPFFGSQGTGSFSDHHFHVDGALYARTAATGQPPVLARADLRIARALP